MSQKRSRSLHNDQRINFRVFRFCLQWETCLAVVFHMFFDLWRDFEHVVDIRLRRFREFSNMRYTWSAIGLSMMLM